MALETLVSPFPEGVLVVVVVLVVVLLLLPAIIGDPEGITIGT